MLILIYGSVLSYIDAECKVLKKNKKILALKAQILRGNLDSLEIIKGIKSLRVTNDLTRELIFFTFNKYRGKRNHLLPCDISDLRKLKQSYKNFGLKNDLIVNFYLFEKYESQINIFLNLYKEFLFCLMNGEYSKAEHILDKIESEVCVSVWGIESRLFIKEYAYGIEENKRYLEQVTKENKDVFLAYLTDFYSYKLEKGTSPSQYFSRTNKFLENLKNGGQTIAYSFFDFKLSNSSEFTEEDLQKALYLEGNSSIIDIYFSSLKLIKLISSQSNLSHILDKLSPLILNLSQTIDDQTLKNVSYKLNPNNISTVSSDDIQFNELIELYTRGKYQECFDQLCEVMVKDPSSIQIYELFTKCCMYLNSVPLTQGESLKDKLINAIWNVLGKTDLAIDSKVELEKIALAFGNLNISCELKYLVNQSFSVKVNQNLQGMGELSSKYITPRFVRIYSDLGDSEKFLSVLEQYLGSTNTITLYKRGSILTDNSISLLGIIPKSRWKRYHADNIALGNDYNSAIKGLIETEYMSQGLSTKYLLEQVSVRLYNNYLELGDVRSCVQLYVDTYLEGQNLVIRMDSERLVNILKRGPLAEEIKRDINYPIFSYLSSKGNYSQNYRSLFNFMRANNLTFPREIIQLNDICPSSKIIFLMKFICSVEILDSFRIFNSPKEIREERIKICTMLSDLDSADVEQYLEEIEELNTQLAVSNKVQQMEQGRVYVDIKGLKNDPENMFARSFDRYLMLRKLLTRSKSVDIHNTTSLKKLGELSEIQQINFSHQDTSQYYIFKEIAFELRDQFLFNEKFGLDASLSTRIRHGALKGEIRNAFDRSNLVLVRQDEHSSEYQLTHYWKQLLKDHTIEEFEIPLRKALGELTKKVDDTVDEMNNQWIRIKTENNLYPKGLLNFTFDDNTLYQFYEEFNEEYTTNADADGFFEEITGLIIARTQVGLVSIQDMIRLDINKKIATYLDDFQNSIDKAGKRYLKEGRHQILRDISTKIVSCRTDIQNQLETVARWFRLMENVDSLDYPIDVIANTVQNYGRWKDLTIKSNVKSTAVLKGQTFVHIFDIFAVVLDNAIDHSKLDKKQLKVNLDIYEETGNIIFEISNNLGKQVDISETWNSINDVKKKIKDIEYIKKQSVVEGRSGFMKICKILLFYLDQNDINLDLKVTSTNYFFVKITITKERIL